MESEEKRELERLRKMVSDWSDILKWYADKENYRGEPRLVSGIGPGGAAHQVWTTPEIRLDKGMRARTALRRLECQSSQN